MRFNADGIHQASEDTLWALADRDGSPLQAVALAELERREREAQQQNSNPPPTSR